MKRDFLGECNDQGVPLEDFRLAFCVRCFQQECSRSQFGTSKFEARVHNWEERLFKAPQLPRTDPRYASISAKRFLTLSSGPAPAIRDWIDPQVVDNPPTPVQDPRPPPPPESRPEPPPNLLVEQPLVEVSVPQQVESPPRLVPGSNTPYHGAITLPGSPPTAPTKDAWAAPAPLKPSEKVVQPGAKVKIGGSG